MTEYIWLFYAVLSAIAAALVSVFGKIGLQGLDANTATVIRAVIMALFLTAVLVVQRNFSHISEILSNRRALLFITLSGIAGALSWLFYFVALKYGKVSQVAPVDKLSVVITIVLAFIFLKEPFTSKSVAGAALITAGTLIMVL